MIEEGEDITIIVDKLDSKINIDYYKKLIDDLYQLTMEYSNFRIWIIPSIKEGVFLNYSVFENTYIIGEETIKLGNLDITYESICRNYPDNNFPSKHEVLASLLQNLAFHKSKNMYFPTKEAIIMSIFLKLLGENSNIQFIKEELSNLEKNFLTSLI